MTEQLLIGMPSGSVQDGVSTVLVNFSGRSMDLLHAQSTPYPVAIRQMLDQLHQESPGPDLIGLLDETLGRFFARVAQDLVRGAGMEMRDILAIGAHGQDTRPMPVKDGTNTLRLGNAVLLARNTGINVVSGFRVSDIAADGRGTSLAPLLYERLFLDKDEDRAVLNIDETANLTWLPANGEVSCFDCGPGNCLINAWTRRHLHKPRDHAGEWAAKGKINEALLGRLLQDPYFNEPDNPGARHLDLDWLDTQLVDSELAQGELGLADVQATITELTVIAMDRSLHGRITPKRLLVCGAGAHNTYLLGRIAAAMPDVVIDTTARYGADPDWTDGLLFAWLAHERLAGRDLDTSAITGVRQTVLLGDIFEP